MARLIIGVASLVLLTLFIRHQYQLVIRRVTSPQTQPIFGSSPPRQETRRKCIMCNGTGRSTFLFAPPGNNTSRICPTCKGTGYVDVAPFMR